MTDTEQRIAIAQACGLEREEIISPLDSKTPLELWKTKDGKGRLIRSASIPDYLNDLNACYEMENTLSNKEKYLYCDELNHIVAEYMFRHHATARQRCEAFLKVKELWKA